MYEAMEPLHNIYCNMKRIINKCPCSLEAWVGADEPVFSEQNLYFSRQVEVKEYLYKRLQKYKGEMVECYVYQFYKGKPREVLVSFNVK